MAMADYRCCDKCGCKAFYDAELNYTDNSDKHMEGNKPFSVAGKVGTEWDYKLDNVGDWAVICQKCSETHETVIRPKSQ